MKTLIPLLMILASLGNVCAVETTIVQANAKQVAANEAVESGRLITVKTDLPPGSSLWFMLTEDVDFYIDDDDSLMRIATPCRDVDIRIEVKGIDWANQKITGQRTVIIPVRHGGPGPSPPPGPVPTPVPDPEPNRPAPSAELQGLIAGIKAKLNTDPAKAKKVGSEFIGFAQTIRGVAGKRIVDANTFGVINAATFTDMGLGSGVLIGADIEKVLEQYANITKTNRVLSDADRQKIADVFDAVAWAGRQ